MDFMYSLHKILMAPTKPILDLATTLVCSSQYWEEEAGGQ